MMNIALKGMKPKRRAWTLAAWALLIAAPFVQLLVVSLWVGHNALLANPVWTDELDCWRSVYSWMNVGGAAGSSGIWEMTAPIGTLSVHGLSPLILYGVFAKVFGWTYSSVVLINAVWISAGALVFCILIHPGAKRAGLMALALMVYAPTVLYCATSMTELANYGLLLFYLTFFIRFVYARRASGLKATKAAPLAAGWPWLLQSVIVVLFCCAYRISYVVLMVPLVVVASDFRLRGRFFALMGVALAMCGVLYFFTSRLISPYVSGFLYNFLRTDSPSLAFQMFLSHAKANLLDYFVRPTTYYMEVLQRVLYCGVELGCLIGTFARVRKVDGRLRLSLGWDGFSMLAFLTLFLPFAVVVCAYETNDWSDYRTLAPFLWLVIAAMTLQGRKVIPLGFLAGCLAILTILATSAPIGAYSDTTRFSTFAENPDRQALYAAVEYNPAATDPFENAVRTDMYDLETLASLPAGMGLQTGWFTTETVGKSYWILTDHLKIPLEGYEIVFSNNAGSVYRLTAEPFQP